MICIYINIYSISVLFRNRFNGQIIKIIQLLLVTDITKQETGTVYTKFVHI